MLHLLWTAAAHPTSSRGLVDPEPTTSTTSPSAYPSPTCEDPKEGVTWQSGIGDKYTQKNWLDCRDFCNRDINCQYWSYKSSEESCWKVTRDKEAKLEWHHASNYVSGYAGIDGCCPNSKRGGVGNDGWTFGDPNEVFYVSDTKECAAKCNLSDSCKKWKYYSSSSGVPDELRNRCHLSHEQAFQITDDKYATSYYKCTPVEDPECPINKVWQSWNLRTGTIGVDGKKISDEVKFNELTTTSEVECAQSCNEDPKCKGWSWKWDGWRDEIEHPGLCELGKAAEFVPGEKYTSSERCRFPKKVQPGYFSHSMKLANLTQEVRGIPSWQDCADHCEDNLKTCFVWTYDTKSNVCYYDDSTKPHSSTPVGFFEGLSGFNTNHPLTTRFSPQYNYTNLEQGYYTTGNIDNWQECAFLCNRESENCVVWTYKASSKTCWYDDAKSTHQRKFEFHTDEFISGFSISIYTSHPTVPVPSGEGGALKNLSNYEWNICPNADHTRVGLDHYGFHKWGYKQIPRVTDTSKCAQLCLDDAKCNAWSYMWNESTPPDGYAANDCYLYADYENISDPVIYVDTNLWYNMSSYPVCQL